MPTEDYLDSIQKTINDNDGQFEDKFDIEWNFFSVICWHFACDIFPKKSEEFQKEFKSANCNENRVKMVIDDSELFWDLEEQYQRITKNDNESSECGYMKNNESAKMIFDQGIEAMKRKDYPESLQKLNEALTYAYHPRQEAEVEMELEEAKSQLNEKMEEKATSSPSPPVKHLMARILGKRAKVLYNLGYFHHALKDIKSAFQLELPSHHAPLLIFIKAACHRALNHQDAAAVSRTEADFLTQQVFSDPDVQEKWLRYFSEKWEEEPPAAQTEERVIYCRPPLDNNSKLPGAHKALTLTYEPSKGRAIRTREDIKAGDLMFCEDPFGHWLRPSLYHSHCYQCMTILGLEGYHFIPCRRCDVVKYCSLECEEKSWDKYHWAECDIQASLKILSFGHLALRMIIEVGFEQCIKVCNEGLIPFKEWPKIGFPAEYRSFFSMVGNEIYLSTEQLFGFVCGSVILGLIGEQIGIIERSSSHSPERFLTFGAFLLKHIFQINFNCYLIKDHGLHESSIRGIYKRTIPEAKIGIAVYLSSSMVSHSCSNNCNKFSLGNRMFMVADKDIPAGQEVTVTYSPHHYHTSYNDRQNFLRDKYLFECNCPACVEGIENVAYAFKCPTCTGPLIWNEDRTTRCLNCKQSITETEMEKIINDNNIVSETLHTGNDLLQKEQYSQARDVLVKGLRRAKQLYYSSDRLHGHLGSLIEALMGKGLIKEAFKVSLEMSSVEGSIYGEDSIEAVNAYLYSVHLYHKMTESSKVKKVTSGGKKRRADAEELFNKAMKSVEELNKREVTVACDYSLKYLELYQKSPHQFHIFH